MALIFLTSERSMLLLEGSEDIRPLFIQIHDASKIAGGQSSVLAFTFPAESLNRPLSQCAEMIAQVIFTGTDSRRIEQLFPKRWHYSCNPLVSREGVNNQTPIHEG